MKNIMILNFKTYSEATGVNAESLARRIERAAGSEGIVIATQNADIFRLSRVSSIAVYAQHIDPVGYGAFTGKDSAQCLKNNGASGVLINHSEDAMAITDIEKSTELAKQAGLKAVVCVSSPEMAKIISSYSPDYIAYEPPELIGSGISVTTKPDAVRKAVVMANGMPVLCGAGITKPEDVKEAVKLGCRGILVASGVVKAPDPAGVALSFLNELAL